jgi:hypothetical protein
MDSAPVLAFLFKRVSNTANSKVTSKLSNPLPAIQHDLACFSDLWLFPYIKSEALLHIAADGFKPSGDTGQARQSSQPTEQRNL